MVKQKAKKPTQKKAAAKKTAAHKVQKVAKKIVAKKKIASKIAEKKAAKGGAKKSVVVKEFTGELPADKTVALKAFETILHPLITEKSVGMIESENKLVFVVNGGASKSEVKDAVESLYKIKVDKVNILRDTKGRKRAFVKISRQFRADEIATKLGVL